MRIGQNGECLGVLNYCQFVAGEPVCLCPHLRRGTDQALISCERQAFRSSDLDRFPAAGADLVAADRLDAGAELPQMGSLLGNRRQEQFVLEV